MSEGRDDMPAQVARRLAQLRREYADGSDLVAQLRGQVLEAEQQLQRIAGAITVCEELLISGVVDPAEQVDHDRQDEHDRHAGHDRHDGQDDHAGHDRHDGT